MLIFYEVGKDSNYKFENKIKKKYILYKSKTLSFSELWWGSNRKSKFITVIAFKLND